MSSVTVYDEVGEIPAGLFDELSPGKRTFGLTLTCRIRHKTLWDLRAKFVTNRALAEYLGISDVMCGELINLKRVPGKEVREKMAPKLAQLGLLVEDVWPDELAQSGLVGSAGLKRDIEKQIPVEQLVALGDAGARCLVDERMNPEEEMLEREDEREAQNILESLTPREEKMLRMRSGACADGRARSLREIGEMFELSVTRVAQIIDKAVAKIRKRREHGYFRERVPS